MTTTTDDFSSWQPANPPPGWMSSPPSQPASRRPLWRRPVAGTLAAVAALGLLALVFVVSANEVGTHDRLHAAQASLAVTKQRLSSTAAQLSSTAATLAQTQQEVTQDQAKISNLQGNLAYSEQLGSEIASVTDALKTCVNDSEQFDSDLSQASATGDYSTALVDAGQADADCSRANAAYNSLTSQLPSSST